MQLTFLGTASCYPTAYRGVSATAVRFPDGKIWLFDCGEGTQVQLQKSTIRPGKIDKIFITHLHGDHLFGLPGLLCTLGSSLSRTEPVEIYGPKGLRLYVRTCLLLSSSLLGYPYTVHELEPVTKQYPQQWTKEWTCNTSSERGSLQTHSEELAGSNIVYDQQCDGWKIYSDEKTEVFASWLLHRVPCFGYVIQEKPQPGRLDAEKLDSLGIPRGPLYGRIKNGEIIFAPDGTQVLPESVTAGPIPGRKLVILGDTCNSDSLLALAKNADLLVHECTLEDSLKEKAIENGHSTPEMLARFASEIQASTVVLTHFSQRYKLKADVAEEGEVTVEDLVSQVEASLTHKCKVLAARDLLTIDVPPKASNS